MYFKQYVQQIHVLEFVGNELERGLKKINREDAISQCMYNVEHVTDDVERAVAKEHLDQAGTKLFLHQKLFLHLVYILM